MSNVVNKLLNMFNINSGDDLDTEEPDYMDGYIDDPEYVDEENKGIFGSRKSSKNTVQPVKVVIMQPTKFENAEEICDLLRERKSIIVNLEYVNKDEARRIIDVISGATHVLDGYMQKISNSIFLIAPYNYEITSDTKEDAKSKLPVSWLKNTD